MVPYSKAYLSTEEKTVTPIEQVEMALEGIEGPGRLDSSERIVFYRQRVGVRLSYALPDPVVISGDIMSALYARWKTALESRFPNASFRSDHTGVFTDLTLE